MCFLPLKIRSESISSEMRMTPLALARETIFSSSSRSHTMPRGLWGLHRRNIFTVLIFSSKSAQSTLQVPSPLGSILFSTTTRSLSWMISKKSPYTGDWIRIRSPGAVMYWIMEPMAGMTPRAWEQQAGSMVQPLRRFCQSQTAWK